MQPVEPGAGAAECAKEAAAAAVRARPTVADVAALAAEDDGLRRRRIVLFGSERVGNKCDFRIKCGANKQ